MKHTNNYISRSYFIFLSPRPFFSTFINSTSFLTISLSLSRTHTHSTTSHDRGLSYKTFLPARKLFPATISVSSNICRYGEGARRHKYCARLTTLASNSRKHIQT